MRRSTLVIGLVLAFVAVAPRLQAQGPDGKALYDKNCKTCHGAQGAPPAALAKKMKIPTIDAAYLAKVSDDSILKVMTNGSKNMKPMKDKLTEPELAAIGKHVREVVGAGAAKPGS
ncbi:MAG: cytochrome c [Gemmatimonadetes bacterium]|nr:cytochrome c [Gemmatimonadota bacterium]